MKRYTLGDFLSLRILKKKGLEVVSRDKGEISLEVQDSIITGKPAEVVNMLDELSRMQSDKELVEVRDIANKLADENSRMVQEVASLRMDKAALVTFIEENVTDETLKNQILPKPDKGTN